MTKPHSLESPSSTVFRYPDGRTVNTTPIATIVKDGNWPEPVPLPPVEPGVPDLAEDLIPKALRPYICDAAERTQIPLCFVAVPAMVAMGSLVGRTVGIYPKQADNWLVVPNLWGLVIGRPGVLKSPAIKAGLKPLSRLSAEAREIFESDTAERETDMQIARAELEAAKKSVAEALKKGTKDAITGAKADLLDMNRRLEQKSGLIQKRYTTNDPTIESVGVLLKENPRGILLVRDELYGLLRSMDKFGREGDREFYLEAWNGDGNEGFDIDRIGRGHIHIEALCLSIIGGMQPGKFRSYAAGAFRGGTGDDGLLQRFQLAVWPEVSPGWENIDRAADAHALEEAYRFFKYLDDLDIPSVSSVSSQKEIPGLRFSPEAQELFDAWRQELEFRLRSPEMERTPAFESHLAKYRSLMPSIALLLHLADNPESMGVSLDAATRAAAWCEFLEQHANKIYAQEIRAELSAAHRLYEKIITSKIEDGKSVREIYRPQWSGLSTPESVWPALRLLERHNIISIDHEETGGRATDILNINPKTLRGE